MALLSEDNPADCASRGINLGVLITHPLTFMVEFGVGTVASRAFRLQRKIL